MSDLGIITTLVKHLPGQHEQKRHAGGRNAMNAANAINRAVREGSKEAKNFADFRLNMGLASKYYNKTVELLGKNDLKNAREYLAFSIHHIDKAEGQTRNTRPVREALAAVQTFYAELS